MKKVLHLKPVKRNDNAQVYENLMDYNNKKDPKFKANF